MINKYIAEITISALVLTSVPVVAMAGALQTLGIGAAAVFGAVQINHNNKARKFNQGVYNQHKLGTFYFGGQKVNCHIENDSKACYSRDASGHWNYIRNG